MANGQQEIVAVDVDLRPTVAAWLIPSGDRSALRRAVRGASQRWGGIGEPIIPVSPTGKIQPIWRRVLETMHPDVFIDVGLPSEAAREVVDGGRLVPEQRAHRLTNGAHPLMLLDVSAPASPLNPMAHSTRSLRDEAAVGWIPDEDEAGWTPFVTLVADDAGGVGSARHQLERRTVLWQGLQFAPEESTVNAAGLPLALWVTRPGSYRDVLWFWNYRAMAPRYVRSAPMALVSPSLGRQDRFEDILREMLAGANPFEPSVVLCSLSEPTTTLVQIAARLGLVPHLETGAQQSATEVDAGHGALDYVVNADLGSYLAFERYYGHRTHVSAPVRPPTARIEADLRTPINPNVQGTLRVRISGLPMSVVPERETVARLFHPLAYWDRTGAIGMNISPVGRIALDLNIPEPPEVLAAVLADRDIKG